MTFFSIGVAERHREALREFKFCKLAIYLSPEEAFRLADEATRKFDEQLRENHENFLSRVTKENIGFISPKLRNSVSDEWMESIIQQVRVHRTSNHPTQRKAKVL